MGQTINNAYIAALVNGLASPDWLSLDSEEQSLLNRAKALMGRGESPQSPKPLTAITGRVWGQECLRYFQPGRLSLREPSSIFAEHSVAPEIPDTVAQGISAEIEQLFQLYGKDSPGFRYALYHSVYAWGSRIAFEKQDVSAFDHNRLLAASIACLKSEPDGFLLLKGAIAGIQSFIYHDIGGEQIGDARKASKRLRGRSFLVAHLCQAIAEFIVEDLELEQANILFVGGGHFNLLLPDTVEVHDRLIELRKNLNMGFLESVGMQLSVLMEWEKASGARLFNKAPEYFQKVTDKMEHAKNERHIMYLDEFFEKQGKRRAYKEDETLGEKVPYASFILEVTSSHEGLKALDEILEQKEKAAIKVLEFLHKHYFLFGSGWEPVLNFIRQYGRHIVEHGGSIKILKINDTEFIPASLDTPAHLGFLFIGNSAPRKPIGADGETLYMFEEIAQMDEAGRIKEGETTLSYPQLAALRLDVDDLGTLFGYGLGSDASFGGLSALSREFQLFFGGYFNVLAERHHMYVTYSGGDDAFVIGSWLNAVHFAEDLHRAFGQFTCQNPEISFSAGLFTCSPYYPVVRFAEDAAQLLDEKAKNFKASKTEVGKNAICIFDHTLDWDHFGSMMDFARKLLSVVPREREEKHVVEGRNLRRSMLQHLLKTIQAGRLPLELAFAQEDDMTLEEKKVLQLRSYEFYRNIGRLHGLFSRHGYGEMHLKSRKDTATEIIRELLQKSGSQEHFADFIVPIQYVLYKTRTKTK